MIIFDNISNKFGNNLRKFIKKGSNLSIAVAV